MAGADSGWTSCGTQFNYFDKEMLRGCLEWRMPASDQAFTHVEYLMHESNFVMSGVRAFAGEDRNAMVVSIGYDEC